MTTESRTTHTPGPWRMDWKRRRATFIVDAGGHDLAEVFLPRTTTECTPNAHLIAAAPELLAMAEEAVVAFGNLLRGSDRKCYCGIDKGVCTVCKLNAAIKKARGES